MAAKKTGDMSVVGRQKRRERRQRERFIFAVSLRSLTSAISQRAAAPGALLTKHENLDARFTRPT